MSAEQNGLSRRDLLRAATLGALTLGAGGAALGENADKAAATEDRNPHKDMPHRRLGRTNMMVSVIGAGCGSVSSPEILHRAIDQGVNYIDTAPIYPGSEESIGEVMKTRRKEVFLATKWHVFANTQAKFLSSLDNSLKTLKTDVIDLMLLHSVDSYPGSNYDGKARIDSPELHAAMETAKKSGKVRYFGVSSHNPKRKEFLTHAIDTGLFDAILVAFSYGNYEQAGIPELVDYAKKHDIGVIGMKAAHGNIDVPKVKPLAAQLAWALSKGIHAVINSNITKNEETQDGALAAAKVKLAQADRDTLEQYALAVTNEYCRGCSHICESACPANVRIGDILRFDMYHRHYGEGYHPFAKQSYAELTAEERVLSICGSCRKCEEACPYDLPVVEKLRYVDRELA